MKKPTTPRRWEITAVEHARIAARRRRHLDLHEVARTLIKAPHIWPEVAGMVVEGATRGVFGHSALLWLVDSERVHQEVPDAARGIGFTDEQAFLSPLLPRLDPAIRVLEVGCGDGRIARHVVPRVRELVCSDVSTTMLREAQENLVQFHNVRFVRTHGFKLADLPSAEFDLVYAQGVFSYLDSNQALSLLDEVRRVLKEGGTAVLNFYTPLERPDWAADHLTYVRAAAQRGRFGTGQRVYAVCQLEQMFAAVSLRVVSRDYYGDTRHNVPCVVIGQALAFGGAGQPATREPGEP